MNGFKMNGAAGHHVTLVAPLTNQSGSGARFTTRGVLDFTEQSTGVWTVDGSPADAVRVALTHHLKGSDAPDLVISGANFGQNLGYASTSGTVGAATASIEDPAVIQKILAHLDDNATFATTGLLPDCRQCWC